MKISLNKERVRFFLLMSGAYGLLNIIINISSYPGYFLESVANNIWQTLYLIVVNYIFFEFTIEFVLRKRKYLLMNILLGAAALFIHCMFWSYGMYLWKTIGIELHIFTLLNPNLKLGRYISAQMAYSAGSVFFIGVTRHIYNYVKLKQAEQLLRIEKQASELNYLRSQTNPHFLFNTLNNIYVLTKQKSDRAPESVMRLSKLLRFMLYETSGEYISIGEEIKIIDDYIELEKLRHDKSLQVDVNYDLKDMKQPIPPLLLIPLVENAFKHGVSESIGKPFVQIHLSVKEQQLIFTVKNSTELAVSDYSIKENIGLSNLRRQLELLYTEYELDVRPTEYLFTAILKIKLSSHV